jgi:pyruvate dehydrogenase E2 component (dihydrolipoamide acetyltransferase)
MISITFQFTDVAAAAGLLAQLNTQQLAAVVPAEAAPAPKSAKPAAKPAPAAPNAPSQPTAEAAPSPAPAAPAPATPQPVAEKPTAAPAAAPSAPAEITYAELTKQVLALHKLDPTAAVPIAKSLGADTFKLLKPEQWPAAHRLVTEAIAARS